MPGAPGQGAPGAPPPPPNEAPPPPPPSGSPPGTGGERYNAVSPDIAKLHAFSKLTQTLRFPLLRACKSRTLFCAWRRLSKCPLNLKVGLGFREWGWQLSELLMSISLGRATRRDTTFPGPNECHARSTCEQKKFLRAPTYQSVSILPCM